MKASAPESTAARTTGPLRNPMGGNCGATGGGGAGGASGSSSTKTGSSRVGLPPLWQKRASSGSFAPQVQYSGTPSVWHVILDFAMSGQRSCAKFRVHDNLKTGIQIMASMDTPPEIDWTQCELIERVPGKVSGRPIVRGTR